MNRYKKKPEVLAEEISRLPYGEIIYHSGVSDILSEPYGTQKYQQYVQAARKILLNKYGILLESIRKCGYRVVEPGNYVGQSLKHYKREGQRPRFDSKRFSDGRNRGIENTRQKENAVYPGNVLR